MNRYIKTAFRQYMGYIRSDSADVVALQQHHNVYPDSPWEMYAPNSYVLPFQFFISANNAVWQDMELASWNLIRVDAPGTINLSSVMNTFLVPLPVADKGLWWSQLGYPLETPIPCGIWYSVIDISGRKVVSERFHVKTDAFLNQCSFLEWANTCDTAGIIYSSNVFVNQVYLDSVPENLTPVLYEEGVENADKIFIPTKVENIYQYQMVDLMPEFMVEAIHAVRLHNKFKIIFANRSPSRQSFEVKLRDVTQSWESPKIATLTMKLEALEYLKTEGCCNNEIASPLFPLVTTNSIIQLETLPLVHVTKSILDNVTGYNVVADAVGISTTSGGGVIMFADGTYDYTPPSAPPPGYIGYDSFVAMVVDGFGATGNVTIEISMDLIHAEEDYYVTNLWMPTTSFDASQGLLANDFMPYDYAIAIPIHHIGGATSQTIMSLEGDGNYIVVNNVTGAFVFHRVVTPFTGINTFHYRLWRTPISIGPNTLITIESA